MIPKVIHYCWFGNNKKPKLVEKCIASWRKYCPDYEIVEWNEDTFDVTSHEYTKFTRAHNMYAYLSDYVRLKVVYEHGGIYLDTDVEIIKPLDDLLKNSAFLGFESEEYVNTGIGFGAEKGNKIIKAMLSQYDEMSEDEYKGKYERVGYLTGSPTMNTNALLKYGLIRNNQTQNLGDAVIYSSDYFCPMDDLTGIITKTENTYSIHWYGKSAQGKAAYVKSFFSRLAHRIVKRRTAENE